MFKKIFNFGPKKEDKIEWWTAIEGLENIAPVQTSSHYIPDWWQKTPHWQDDGVKEDNIKSNYSGFRFDDELVKVKWPKKPIIISIQDKNYPKLDLKKL